MTAMVILTANSMHTPQHNHLILDIQLIEAGLQVVDKMVQETGSEMLKSFEATCAELHQHTQRRCLEATIDRHFKPHKTDPMVMAIVMVLRG